MLHRFLLLFAYFASFAATALDVQHTQTPIEIDGKIDSAWHQTSWQPMPFLMAGSLPEKSDFNGRYRLLWDENYLYLQAEITDDILFDHTPDPLVNYWDDDSLEVFIDGDASGGDHQYNHSAFAYHIALDNQAADIGDDKKAHLYNDHLFSSWQRRADKPNSIIWEVAIKMYPNTYTDLKPAASLKLSNGDIIGFMLAYCDNDASENREHFMGSDDIKAVNGDKNRGWIDSSVFGKLTLVP